MSSQIEGFLANQLPICYQLHIPAALKTAYETAARIAKEEPVFSMMSAKDNHGRLVSWATDFAILRLIKSGSWPFDYKWETFDKPTGRFLQVVLPESTLSISQVKNRHHPPRKVGFRENAALSNQPYLFPTMEEERMQIFGLPSFILIHGHQGLKFAHIGMSKPGQKSWMYRTGNLLELPKEVGDSDVPPVEHTEESVLMLKEDIMKWRRDNG
ncbi:hypothetical protein [Halomonas sp. JS92-SW72]|uniref:hypothetical protein n=1 Tax=Halomonas sp. JS92-SW72 TaxID=2306583 RepID=UPI0013C3005B|nr:hypothetical protein [Halomonas sp. JS92-SW72]